MTLSGTTYRLAQYASGGGCACTTRRARRKDYAEAGLPVTLTIR